MTNSKEKILEELIDLILTLKNKSKEFDKKSESYNHALVIRWTEKQKIITEAIESLNSCDSIWLNDEYAKWAQDNLVKDWDKIKASFKDHSEWGK